MQKVNKYATYISVVKLPHSLNKIALPKDLNFFDQLAVIICAYSYE